MDKNTEIASQQRKEAMAFLNGDETHQKDEAKAIELFILSADNGDDYSAFTLAEHFREKDKILAKKYYEKTIENNGGYKYVAALYLAEMYFLGDSIPKDYLKAKRLYQFCLEDYNFILEDFVLKRLKQINYDDNQVISISKHQKENTDSFFGRHPFLSIIIIIALIITGIIQRTIIFEQEEKFLSISTLLRKSHRQNEIGNAINIAEKNF